MSQPRQQQRGKSRWRFGERRKCADCPAIIAVQRYNHVLCRSCAVQRKRSRKQTYPHGNLRAPQPLPRAPRVARLIYRPDFLLYFPAMRAELERQTGSMTMPRLFPNDPLEISNYRVSRQRRGTGNGPRNNA